MFIDTDFEYFSHLWTYPYIILQFTVCSSCFKWEISTRDHHYTIPLDIIRKHNHANVLVYTLCIFEHTKIKTLKSSKYLLKMQKCIHNMLQKSTKKRLGHLWNVNVLLRTYSLALVWTGSRSAMNAFVVNILIIPTVLLK